MSLHIEQGPVPGSSDPNQSPQPTANPSGWIAPPEWQPPVATPNQSKRRHGRAIAVGAAAAVAIAGGTTGIVMASSGNARPATSTGEGNPLNNPGANVLPAPVANTPSSLPNLNSIPALPGTGSPEVQQSSQEVSQAFLNSIIDDQPDVGYALTFSTFRQAFTEVQWENVVNKINFAFKSTDTLHFIDQTTTDTTSNPYSIVRNTLGADQLPALVQEYQGLPIATDRYAFHAANSDDVLTVMMVQKGGQWLVADYMNEATPSQ